MKSILLILFFTLEIFGINRLFAGTIKEGNLKLNIHGVKRELYFVLPKKSHYPLVIALHGGGDNVKSFVKYSKIKSLVTSLQTFGVVYPKGINKHWNDGRKESGSEAEDVLFIKKIIHNFKKRGVSKFYLIGMSNGGLMAQRMACEIPSQIDGMVIVAATQSSYLQEHCVDNITPVKSLFIFGTNDPIFSEDFHIAKKRGLHIGIDATLEYWLYRNACSSELKNIKRLNDKEDKTSIEIYQAKKCKKNLVYYKVENGGHRWPDPHSTNGFIIRKFLGRSSHEIVTAKTMVDFFGF